MNDFEYLALVCVIPLGLALVEIAQGLADALKRHARAIGWLTPLVALLLLQNLVVIFWNLYNNQHRFEVSLLNILIALVLSVAFYLAASFAFPGASEEQDDLDAWFMRHRAKSVGLVGFITFFADVVVFGEDLASDWLYRLVVLAIFLAPLVLAIRTARIARARTYLLIANLMLFLVALFLSS
ncbi:hypothetical protein [Sphingomicrobium astaxanthinifaciens]|uniref:hypothetical protein n=1 Tax=Sphingomicrobium astaxanthinifaciens TaxID=1227949 RepID=UPI001FCBE0D0|nr:hypothetical protein [Sphingomicrobium astaxanthinifaciens]MCJ7422055.1 hypothetical protein [Sphingomicrobium astaxanthinifaciens]